MAAATICWICHKPGTDDDPLTADHLLALHNGGHHTAGNYRAAHRSCNSRRGATITNASAA